MSKVALGQYVGVQFRFTMNGKRRDARLTGKIDEIRNGGLLGLVALRFHDTDDDVQTYLSAKVPLLVDVLGCNIRTCPTCGTVAREDRHICKECQHAIPKTPPIL